jgi:hypothetical protein
VSLTGELPRLVEPAPRSRADRRWDRWRHVLLLGWVVLVAAAAVLGERAGSWQDVQAGVASGEVHTVRIADALPAGSTGYATVQVQWRTGPWRHQARVVQVQGAGAASDGTATGDEVSAVVHGEPGAQLAALHPGLHVQRIDSRLSDSALLGWWVPSWMGLAAFALFVGSLVLLVGGPEPWRATRWAWFWLLWGPVGNLAFLLLAGPAPMLPQPRSRSRRLTGGWALLLAVVLAAALAPYSW